MLWNETSANGDIVAIDLNLLCIEATRLIKAITVAGWNVYHRFPRDHDTNSRDIEFLNWLEHARYKLLIKVYMNVINQGYFCIQ